VGHRLVSVDLRGTSRARITSDRMEVRAQLPRLAIRVRASATIGLPVVRSTVILRLALGLRTRPAPRRGWWVDREVIERAQRGDESAFAKLALEHGDRLHAIARHVLRDSDQAADATQQALVQIWRNLPQLKDPGRFEGWAYRIVLRAAYAEQRRRTAWRLAAPHVEPASSQPSTDPVDDRDELDWLFSHLSLDHRTVLVLKHYAGLRDAEIARIVEISEGTVRSRVFYAMRQVREVLRRSADRSPGANRDTD